MLGEKLRLLRVEAELSQKQIAEKLSISDARYNQYEKGKRSPDYETLKRIANYYNVTTDYLLGNSTIRNYAFAYIDFAPSKDFNDIKKILERTKNILINTPNLQIDSQPATREAVHSILDAMQIGIELAVKKNKKYLRSHNHDV